MFLQFWIEAEFPTAVPSDACNHTSICCFVLQHLPVVCYCQNNPVQKAQIQT